jgi:hypothetical protein
MTTNRSLLLTGALALLVAAPLTAQQAEGGGSAGTPAAGAASDDKAAVNTQPNVAIQYFRPGDQRGLHMFEAPKQAGAPYAGFRLDWTAAFAQQFQNISHSNTASARTLKDATGKDYNANELMSIGWGFNLATANLGAERAARPRHPRRDVDSYLSSRHHQEAWVKDGYLQIDESPIDHPVLNRLMDYVTVKAGMFQLNYGDAHFRRSDNGNALHNPFVGNLILDALELRDRRGGLRPQRPVAMVGDDGGRTRATSPRETAARRSSARSASTGR